MLSDRYSALPEYPLDDIPDAVARLREDGVDVIDLGAGDSGLPVPGAAVEALREAAGDPALQGYAFQRGLMEFRRAVAEWMEVRFGRRPDPVAEVLPLIGSKEGIAHFPFAVLDPGDRALVPDPGYAAYLGGCHMAGAVAERARLEAAHDFLVPPDRISGAGPGLGLVYLNYPNNPTGACADRAYFEEVAERCRERGAVLLHDNPYSEIAFDGYRPPGVTGLSSGLEGVVEFHSFSKSFNMTGWRLGWAVGDPRLIRALSRVKSYFDTGAYLPLQAAGAAVLRDPDAFLGENLRRLAARREAAVEGFREAGFEVRPPRATLYLWMPVPTDEDDGAFVRRILREVGVVLLPGSSLGEAGAGYVRAALSEPPERCREAAERIRSLL